MTPICWFCNTRSRRSGLRGPKNQERLFREFLCYHSHLGRSKSSKSGNPSPIRTFICTLETFFKRYLSSKRAGICPKQTHNIGSLRKVPTAIPIFASRWSKYFEGDEEKKSVHWKWSEKSGKISLCWFFSRKRKIVADPCFYGDFFALECFILPITGLVIGKGSTALVDFISIWIRWQQFISVWQVTNLFPTPLYQWEEQIR